MTDAETRPKILLVEDETAVREHIAAALANEFEVQTAADGEQALRMLPHVRPDLIVTDVLMPLLDGVEFVRLLRDAPGTATIPVLMIRGHAPDELRLQGFQIDADAYLAKPYTERELRACIRGMLNIRQRKRVTSESQLHTHILHALTEGVCVSREDGTIIFTNDAEDGMFGYEPGELIGQHVTIQNAYAAEENERIVRDVLQRLQVEGAWEGEWYNRRKDGSTFYTRASINTIDREGQRFWLCVRRDISAEKSAQQALKDSEERYRAFVANTSEGIWRFELDPPLDLNLSIEEQVHHIYRHGQLAELNDAMARMYGYERAGDLVGAPLAKTLPPGEGAYEYLRTIAQARYSLSNVESIESDRSGNLHYFSNSLMPVIRDGKVLRAWGTQRDITDSKRAEQMLRESERHKDEFLAILAHELRNPLAPIRNGVQILRLRVSGDDLVERVVLMMERQMTHLVRLVDDLLDVSRISSGRLELRCEPVLVADAIASAVDAANSLISGNEHKLIVETKSPNVVVEGDASRLTQIFTNLLSNAARYTEHGGTISLELESEGDDAVITVRDTGIGIPPSDLARIFEMFSQVESHRDRASGGLGIGLALVRKLVQMHNGSVTAHSAGPGQGSTFVVRLPMMRVENNADSGRRDERAQTETPSRRVLVVDDNLDAAQSLASLLEIAGHEVRTADDGEQAVETTQLFEPHVVFMDLGMPRMDGLEAARRIRKLPKGRQTTLVAVTGWGQLADRDRTRDAGFDQHLVKPVSAEELENVLARNALVRNDG